MNERDADKRAEKLERAGRVGGGTAESTGAARQAFRAPGEQAGDETVGLMEEVLRRENLMAAYRRVVRNQGAGGVDGRSVDDLKHQIREDWPQIREALLSGTYQPSPVRKVEIPKPGGGIRMLGIPTVMDRMIQQALLQALTPIFDPTFSEDSYGFRPGRSAQQAVVRAREHIAEGRRWVVDLDLEKFFDTVQHDVLMSRVARRVRDKRVLRVIGRYLRAGIMEGGAAPPRKEGTPQGGPLSPLLSNILLDELDKELERRGHKFVRYADDFQVYVESKRAGERVMASLEGFLSKRLRLKVNREKSAVGRPWKRKFLGYRTTTDKKPKLKPRPEVGEAAETEAEGLVSTRTRVEPRAYHQGTQPDPAGLGYVLPAGGRERSIRRTGPVDTTTTAPDSMASVEATTNPAKGTPEARSGRRTCRSVGVQRTRPVVERGHESHEPGRTEQHAEPDGAREPTP